MSLDLIFAITAAIFGPLITGIFGVVVIRQQRDTHSEIKSPNGTRTGEKVYAIEVRQGVIADLVNKLDTRVARLEINEQIAHEADQRDRDEKTATVKAALEATPSPSAVVVVNTVPPKSEAAE